MSLTAVYERLFIARTKQQFRVVAELVNPAPLGFAGSASASLPSAMASLASPGSGSKRPPTQTMISPPKVYSKPRNGISAGLSQLDQAINAGNVASTLTIMRNIIGALDEQLDYWSGDLAEHADGLSLHHSTLKLAAQASKETGNRIDVINKDLTTIKEILQNVESHRQAHEQRIGAIETQVQQIASTGEATMDHVLNFQKETKKEYMEAT